MISHIYIYIYIYTHTQTQRRCKNEGCHKLFTPASEAEDKGYDASKTDEKAQKEEEEKRKKEKEEQKKKLEDAKMATKVATGLNSAGSVLTAGTALAAYVAYKKEREINEQREDDGVININIHQKDDDDDPEG